MGATAAIEAAFTEVLEGLGLTLAKLAQPLRVALTGKTVSPGIFEVIEVIGRDRVIRRIEKGGRLYREGRAEVARVPA